MAASVLTAIYHMPRDDASHRDLGAAYLAHREGDKQAIAQRLARRLRALGCHVDLKAAA